MTSRVSSSGRYLVFMSARSLTGYDNRDAVSGEADEEVYLYDEASGRLRCLSCDPTGARPHGVCEESEAPEQAPLVDPNVLWLHHSIAGNIPGWTRGGDQGADLELDYPSRVLSDEGRVFFDSTDALVPQDTNGREDVYEYEPEGIGSCTRSEGCVALISSGTSSDESAFLDASGKGPGGEEGEDVFFVTASRLVPQDVDSEFDVYDAHVCSSVAPCSNAPVPAPLCTSGDSCKAAPSPQPSIFGDPASATFSGAGNVAASVSTPAVTPKSLTRAQKLAKALKACKRKPKKKRAVCEKQARKQYGASKATKTNRRGKS